MTAPTQEVQPRLSLIAEPEDPQTREQFARLAAGGGLLNLHRTMAHAPALMTASGGLAAAFRHDTKLPRALIELLIMRTAQVVNCDYIWARHLLLAHDCGVTELQIAELAHWPDSATFTAAEKAALGFAEKACLRQPVSDEDFAELRRHFSSREIVEMTMLVGHYVSTAIFILALSMPPEPA